MAQFSVAGHLFVKVQALCGQSRNSTRVQGVGVQPAMRTPPGRGTRRRGLRMPNSDFKPSVAQDVSELTNGLTVGRLVFWKCPQSGPQTTIGSAPRPQLTVAFMNRNVHGLGGWRFSGLWWRIVRWAALRKGFAPNRYRAHLAFRISRLADRGTQVHECLIEIACATSR